MGIKDAIAENLGYLGVGSLQVGSTVIQATIPPSLTECAGAGDTIRVGDVVIDTSDNRHYPHRIEAIFPSDCSRLGPSILSREIDAAPQAGPTSYLAWGPGWRRSFKLLTQSDVDSWFEGAKTLREDGWHDLPDFLGRVLVLEGVPIEIERSSIYQTMAHVVARAEQMLGFDIKPCRTYANKSKLNMKVKKAVRRGPPKV